MWVSRQAALLDRKLAGMLVGEWVVKWVVSLVGAMDGQQAARTVCLLIENVKLDFRTSS
jgi:hypothetical protein